MTWYEKNNKNIGRFWENEVLTELINMKTAENRTALSQTDLILLSFEKFQEFIFIIMVIVQTLESGFLISCRSLWLNQIHGFADLGVIK